VKRIILIMLFFVGCAHNPKNYHLPTYPDVAILDIKGKRFTVPNKTYEYQIWISGHGKWISAEVWTNPILGTGLDQKLGETKEEITEYEVVMLWGFTVKFPAEGNYYIRVKLWNKFAKDVKFYHIHCKETPGYEQPDMPRLDYP